MSRGYLVMAQGDYIKQAEALAISIRATQSSIKNISIITDGDVDSSLFDKIIPIPENDLAREHDWKIHNRVYFYDLSPYDETVVLDADMLFLTDVSHWWDLLEKYDLLVTDKVKTFRDEWVTFSPYRKAFTENKLPNLYSAFTYFKKCELAETFFNLLKSIIVNWKEWSLKCTPDYVQPNPSIDLAMAMAASVMGIENIISSPLDYPTFTHMKGGCQGWKRADESWNDVLGVYTTNGKIKLGPYIQTGILHYVKKDFVNQDIIEVFK